MELYYPVIHLHGVVLITGCLYDVVLTQEHYLYSTLLNFALLSYGWHPDECGKLKGEM
jgi:hypothetical protein